MPTVTHDCTICGEPHAPRPVMGRDGLRQLIVVGWVHDECRRRQSEARQRTRAARQARKWEEAGQQTLTGSE